MSWADVMYVNLFLKDIATFARANEKYMEHITENICLRGVPSRCCVELPLVEGGMGGVMVEILAARGQSKRVLHVQSISCWAPSCIGPYSQATLCHNLLYMAGQLGLDPPTMTLVSGGAAVEMMQALRNCDAVGDVFTSSLLSCVLSFTVYCASACTLLERGQVEEVINTYLRNAREKLSTGDPYAYSHREVTTRGDLPGPLVLYILVPALPKSALVEVSPLAHIWQTFEDSSADDVDECQDRSWRKSVLQCPEDQRERKCHQLGEERSFHRKEDFEHLLPLGQQRFMCGPSKALILRRHLCRAVSFIFWNPCEETTITRASSEWVASLNEVLPLVTLESSTSRQIVDGANSKTFSLLTDAVSECIMSLGLTLEDAFLDWSDVIMFRMYFVVSIISAQNLREAVEVATGRFSKSRQKLALVPKPTFIPVLGVGETTEMRGAIGVELTASGGVRL